MNYRLLDPMTRKTLFLSILSLSALFASSGAFATPASLDPEPRLVTYPWMTLSTWYKMHAEDVELATKGEAKIVFIGDSITQGWNGRGQKFWDESFSPMGAVNFGIGGDMTQNLIWRMEYGATGNLDPNAVVLMIGTNNFAFTEDSPEVIAAGIVAVVDRLERSFPNAQILLFGVFPRSESPDHPLRGKIKRINQIISNLENRDRVEYLDIGNRLLESDGRISKEIMPDFLHLSEKGYQRWADAVLPWLKEQVAP